MVVIQYNTKQKTIVSCKRRQREIMDLGLGNEVLELEAGGTDKISGRPRERGPIHQGPLQAFSVKVSQNLKF